MSSRKYSFCRVHYFAPCELQCLRYRPRYHKRISLRRLYRLPHCHYVCHPYLKGVITQLNQPFLHKSAYLYSCSYNMFSVSRLCCWQAAHCEVGIAYCLYLFYTILTGYLVKFLKAVVEFLYQGMGLHSLTSLSEVYKICEQYSYIIKLPCSSYASLFNSLAISSGRMFSSRSSLRFFSLVSSLFDFSAHKNL